jgi:hypothetical protein
LYELEIEGRRTLSDGTFGDWSSMRDVHGDADGSRAATAQARMVGGAKGRADHGSLPSSPRSARARAYTSHSLPTHVSFQRIPWDEASAGVARSKIQNVFITSALLGALLLNPSVFGATAEAQSACRATTRQLSTIGPRLRLERLAARERTDGDVMADGVACGVGPEFPIASVVNLAGRPLLITPQLPVARAAILGGVADPRDDGPAWNGRGANLFVRAGFAFDYTWFHAVLAPELWYAQNKSFETFPSPDSARSSLSSPWYVQPQSIDLPSRFGVRPVSYLGLGESAVWATVGPVDLGVSTSTQHWGPAERGALVIGADAPGVPRIFARTSHPVRTRAGSLSATVFAGTLTESRYFDRNEDNDLRSITAWNVAWSSADSGGFTVGLAHAEQRAGERIGGSDSAQRIHGPSDQINEVYAQYRDPRSGIRAWVELGRAGALPTARRFFTVPYQGITYVVGAERALALIGGSLLLSFEAANLEQPTDVRGGARQDFYTSADIPQGWSQRGQILGNAAGPGAQSQWASVDWVAKRWSLGIFGDRVRSNEDALIRQYLAYPNRHDVTIRGGLRGGLVFYGNEIAIEASIGTRLNYLFQNAAFIPGYRTVDLAVPALRFAITPLLSR